MHWIDWLIVIIPILFAGYIGLKAQRYVSGVSDFLTAGRVAGRYVLCVAGAEAAFGLVSLIGMFEVYYQSGFAYNFWSGLMSPILLVLMLTGFGIYRYRETRAMTMGQFLEIRYSRSFRIFAAILQSVSGIVNYGLFPAIGARFLVYFCGFPLELDVFGFIFPTFAVVMAIFLSVAVLITTMGGQLTVMITDCFFGILSYPFYAIIIAYILFRFSWSNDMLPVLLSQPAGKSFINPFDIEKLRDFNLFYVAVGIFGYIVNRMSMSYSQGYNSAAINAHEQKMGGVLGAWRAGFSLMMYVLLVLIAFVYLTNTSFSGGTKGSIECRKVLAEKVFDDVAYGEEYDAVRKEYKEYLTTDKISHSWQNQTDENIIKSQDKEPMLAVGKVALKSVSEKKAQIFGTVFKQMRVPMALKYILPVGITGIFCAICVFLLISTDTTYLHSWSSIIVQDLVLPIRGKPFTPKQQLTLLRIMIVGVALFAFFFSYFFGQVDYILMFFAVTGAIWLGGSGPCIIGGLYWKRGTTAGAWSALISGSGLAVSAIIAQQTWVERIYPWLYRNGMLKTVTHLIEGISYPFEPYIQWRVTPDRFPINSQEVYAMTMLISISLYIIISLLTCRKPFNMDRMLHRGKYKREGEVIEHRVKNVNNLLSRVIGINNEYTRGDKILAWSVFIWSFGWGFGLCFVVTVIWNKISPWSDQWWGHWFFIKNILVAGIVATVSTVWFSIGGVLDLRKLFKRLKEKETNVLDDGRVINNISADDISFVEKVEHVNIPGSSCPKDEDEKSVEKE